MPPRMHATIGEPQAFALAFGAMIGWGWVVLSGPMISIAGSVGATIAFACGGALSLLVGLTYAELASALPEEGGGFAYSYRAFGNQCAWITGWSMILGYISVSCFEAVALPSAVSCIWPDLQGGLQYQTLSGPMHIRWLAMSLVSSLGVCWMNLRGVEISTRFQTIATGLLAMLGIVFVISGLTKGTSANLEPAYVGSEGVVRAAMMTPFLYVGFDVIPQIAGYTRFGRRRLGVLMILSVAGAILWYGLICFCTAYVLPRSEVVASSMAVADAMAYITGSSAGRVAAVLAGILGIVTSWNAFFLGAARLLCAMGQRGVLPDWFARIHGRYETPINAILFVGVLSAAAPLLGPSALLWFTNAGGAAIVISYFTVVLSFIRLRVREPELLRPYSVRYWQLVAILSVVACLVFMYLYAPGKSAALRWPEEWGILMSWAAIGCFVYWARRVR